MFMVGVAMPFAYARRVSLGESHGRIVIHALRRCFNLVLIAAVFTSIHAGHPTYTLVNVLPQIAFGYLMTLLVLHQSAGHPGHDSCLNPARLHALFGSGIPATVKADLGRWGTRIWGVISRNG